jgi:Na+/H+ antiporter
VHAALGLVVLATTVVVFAGLARRFGLSAPLVLTVVGVVASYLPGVPEVVIEPELVLVGLLPPLLYAAAIRTSLVDFRRNVRPIALLSVGLVIFTTVVVGLIVSWLLPVLPLAAAFALGAVVAPPDAVAATSIARRVGMPRRVVTILEGESLVNDATALVLLSTAVVAISSSVSPWRVGGEFLLAAGGGVLAGVVVAIVLAKIRRRLTDPVQDTALSFLAPFIAYLAGEAIQGSGVLAVVVTGLLLGHKAPVIQTAASRISERTNWRTIQFLLENTVFLLIGMQASKIVNDATGGEIDSGRLVLVSAAVLLAVMVARPAWVFPAAYGARLIPHVARNNDRPDWRYPALVSWAGMRGVVTLAAVFAIPETVEYHEVLVFLALVVVAGTLLLQGSTLPLVVRRLGLAGPDPAEDALQAAVVYQQAAAAGVRRLAEITDEDTSPELLAELRSRSETRSNALWERLGRDRETPSTLYAALREQMLEAEREELLKIRAGGTVDHEVLEDVLMALDIEESILERVQLDSSEREEVLVARPHPAGSCVHLDEAPSTARPKVAGKCRLCVEEGLTWVHLRMCLTCGNVGCCDSSVGKHAD